MSDSIDDEAVAAYLQRHPDFLTRNPGVIEALTPPARHSGDGVLDMQNFMLDRLRGEIENLRDCAVELIETSRTNQSRQNRTHASVLALMGTSDIEHMLRILGDDLPLLLDVDAVAVGFEPALPPLPQLALPDIHRLPEGTVDGFIGDGRDVSLLREMNDDGTIFGASAGLVASAALARLRRGRVVPVGLLAFGSRGSGAFHPGLGTELVEFLARVVERCIHKWLDGPE